VKCVVEQPIEERSRRPGLVRGAHLPEDLTLTRHERVEAGGHSEEMQRRRVIREPVREGGDLVAAEETKRLQRLLVGALADHVQLGAVARRETDALPVARELARERGRLARVERDALTHLDRGMTVRDADEREPHAKWVAGRASRTTITSANAASATYAVRLPCHP
jgi:hypothetical protein